MSGVSERPGGRIMRSIPLFLLLVLFTAGCTLDPDYDQPPLDAPEDWRLIDHDARDLTEAGRRQPGDPSLNAGISLACMSRPDQERRPR